MPVTTERVLAKIGIDVEYQHPQIQAVRSTCLFLSSRPKVYHGRAGGAAHLQLQVLVREVLNKVNFLGQLFRLFVRLVHINHRDGGAEPLAGFDVDGIITFGESEFADLRTARRAARAVEGRYYLEAEMTCLDRFEIEDLLVTGVLGGELSDGPVMCAVVAAEQLAFAWAVMKP